MTLAFAAVGILYAATAAWSAKPDVDRGQKLFGSCAACHSLQPNQNMTGPSLAGLWNRKAGSLASFPRYSDALKSSTVVWNDKSLYEWIKDPQRLIPGNDMTFQGIKSDQQRADLLAFLKQATQPGQAPQTSAMMGGVSSLRMLSPENRVQAIGYCGDTYRVTTGDGKTRAFWERNLRLKTDSSRDGPEKGAPAMVGAGMMGDRADVIFAAPDEIGAFIKPQC